MPDEAFDAGWLALREPADHRARAASLIAPLREAWIARGWRRILDLGCGTGSNLRYLAPQLPGAQEWTLLDRDPTLLSQVRLPDAFPRTTLVCGDLVHEGLAAVSDTDLVTASALLDLTSGEWVSSLVEACRAAGCGVFFTLTYDGEIRWVFDAPGDDGAREATDRVNDELVRAAVNDHQMRNKGLGPALGPTAGRKAERMFREAGYHTRLEASPWRLGPSDARLSRALITGWARAAGEERPEEADRWLEWADRRRARVAEAGVTLVVGHVDLLALPPHPGGP